ncbi:hypothetical protein DFH07DRAFT_170594 [Mycena maculata]|uniref:Uncharacterized protein n=1 Tax=Mycena maculata TaxID=230809 RepID=A0AAD7JVM0_9AGAR|nr:hypothetical protein DFH07DRAFT_170594 [Mycena maculata]
MRPQRSMSNPNELGGTANPFGDGHEFLPSSWSTSSGANPFSTAPRPSKTRAPLPHAFSDPTPVRPRLDGSLALQPRALVISGLENATAPSQRALSRVLAEKRVVLEDEDGDELWNLPDGFIMVYVCPLDVHERPPINKSLLDKFAMSATVAPHHSVRALLSPSRNSGSYRNSPALHSSPLPQVTPTSSPPLLAQPLPLPHHSHTLPLLHHHAHAHHPLLHHPFVPPALLYDLRATYHHTYISPALTVYASDLFSAARHHPQLDGTLLSAQAMKDALHLARAGRVIGGDLTGIELVRDDAAYAATKDGSGNGHANPQNEGESPVTTPLQAATGNGRAHRYQPIEVVVEEVDGRSTAGPGDRDPSAQTQQTWKPEVLEVSEADIARIAPRVMTHRLRVRDGPQDETLGSAMFPAAEDQEDAPEGLGRSTIKEILIGILTDV